MDGLVKVFTQLPDTKEKDDDDFSDRMNSRYTVIVLVVFALVVSMHQYVGTPITCWVPPHFTGAHTKYANAYCWVRNTYYLPYDDVIPAEDEDELRDPLPYYQWVPFILLGQALLFYTPNAIWHSFNQAAGVDADTILNSAQSFTRAEKTDSKVDSLRIIRNMMHRFLSSRRQGFTKAGWRDVVINRGMSGRR